MITLLTAALLCTPQEAAVQAAPVLDPGPPMILDVSSLTRVDEIARLRERMGDVDLELAERAEAHAAWLELRGTARSAEEIARSLEFVGGTDDGTPEVTAFRDERAVAVRGTHGQKRLCLDILESMVDEERIITMKATIHRVPMALVARLLDGRQWASLSDVQRAALSKAIEATGADILSAPQVAFRSGSRAEVSILSETAYVADYRVVVAEDVQVADPVIEVINDGFTLDVVGVALRDRTRLRVVHRVCTLERPIPTEEIVVNTLGSKVTIQKPVVQSIEVESTFDVTAEGGTVALAAVEPGGGAGGGEPRAYVVLLDVETVRVEAEGDR